DEVLDWIDAGQNEPANTLPVVTAKRIGPSRQILDDDSGDSGRGRARRPAIEEDDAAAEPRRRPRRADHQDRPDRTDRPDRSDRSDGGDRSERADRSERQVAEVEASAPPKAATKSAPKTDDSDATTTEVEPAHDAKPIEVSTATREASELESLFPQTSVER